MTQQLTSVHVKKELEIFCLLFWYLCLKKHPVTAAVSLVIFALEKNIKIISGPKNEWHRGIHGPHLKEPRKRDIHPLQDATPELRHSSGFSSSLRNSGTNNYRSCAPPTTAALARLTGERAVRTKIMLGLTKTSERFSKRSLLCTENLRLEDTASLQLVGGGLT